MAKKKRDYSKLTNEELRVKHEINQWQIAWLEAMNKRLANGRYREAMRDIGDKCAARIILVDRSYKLSLPNQDEWHGLNKLERDDEL